MKAFLTIQKKTALAILGAITAVLLALSCLLMGNTTVASAEETVTFSMVNAASVYLEGENTSGIRFAARVPEEDKDQMVSFLVIHKEMLTANDKMSVSTNINEKGDVVAQLCAAYGIEEAKFEDYFTVTEAKKSAYYTEEEFPVAGYYACGAIVDLPSTTYANEFFAVAYYTNAENTRVYASFDESVTRSIAEVANGALAKNYEKYLGLGKVNTLLSFMESYGADRYSYSNTYRNTPEFYRWAHVETDVEVVPYADGVYTGVSGATVTPEATLGGKEVAVSTPTTGTITSPVAGENSSLVKYTIRGTGNESNARAVPFWFSTADNMPVPEEYHAVINEANASGKPLYMGFYVYNATGIEANVVPVTAKASPSVSEDADAMVRPESRWVYVEMPITVDLTSDYSFGAYFVCKYYANFTYNFTNEDTTYVSESIFYVDGFSIYAQDSGDADDVALRQYTTGNYAKYPSINTQYNTVSYEAAGLTKPAGITGNSLVKASIEYTEDATSDLVSVPVRITSIPSECVNASKTVYIGFWFYNATGMDIWAYRLTGANWRAYPSNVDNNQGKSIPNGKWTYVEYSISDYQASAYDFSIVLYKWYNGNLHDTFSYYIDGFGLYTKDPMDLATYSANYAREKDTATLSTEDTDGVSFKYTFTSGFATDGNTGIHTANRGRFFYYEATVGEDPLFGLNAETDWANLYCGFWIKKDVTNNIDVLLTFVNTQDGTTYKGSASMTFTSYNYGHKATGSSTEWQYMEFNLAALYPAVEDKVAAYEYFTSNVTAYQIGISTETVVESTATFYIDEMKIYSKN